MKIAFSVTGPDLARVLSHIARQASTGASVSKRAGGAASTVSPEARRALADDREVDDGQS